MEGYGLALESTWAAAGMPVVGISQWRLAPGGANPCAQSGRISAANLMLPLEDAN